MINADLALLANSLAKAESLLEQTAGCIGLYVNANKTKYTYFKQISHLHSKQKASKTNWPVHMPCQQQLIYWKWCQQTTCNREECYWLVIDQMEVWSVQKNKTEFLSSCSCVHATIWKHHMDVNKTHRKKLELHNYALSQTNYWINTQQYSSCGDTCVSSHKQFK